MLYFVVNSCETKGCNHWRPGGNCAKNLMYIPSSVKYVANIHDATTCQVRKQVDEYRLNKMLEE